MSLFSSFQFKRAFQHYIVISNDWSPQAPGPLVQLFEAWSDILPQFIIDNILDQLILPKVQKAVSDWSTRRDKVPLQTLVFPWLPHIGLRVEEVLGDARRKVRSLFRSWTVNEGIPRDLMAWKDVSATLRAHSVCRKEMGF